MIIKIEFICIKNKCKLACVNNIAGYLGSKLTRDYYYVPLLV